jgi:hypothetical protein
MNEHPKTLESRELAHFLKAKMRMSHIYQPLLIRTLLENNGRASGLLPDARQFISRVGRGFGPPGAVALAVL